PIDDGLEVGEPAHPSGREDADAEARRHSADRDVVARLSAARTFDGEVRAAADGAVAGGGGRLDEVHRITLGAKRERVVDAEAQTGARVADGRRPDGVAVRRSDG